MNMWLSLYTAVFITISCCNFGSFVNGQQAPPGGYYTTRYDHIDVEHILNQKRLVHYYAECLLDRGPCTPQGVEFKKILPEALKTNCLRCTEKQRFVTLKSIRRLKKEYPDVWSQLGTLWDPTGELVEQLENSFKNRNRSSELTLPPPSVVSPSATPNVQIIPASLPKPQQAPAALPSPPVLLVSRFADDEAINNNNNSTNNINTNNNNIRSTNSNSNNNNNNLQKQPEFLPTPKLQVQPVTANTIANKPISFSATTLQPVIVETTKWKPLTTFNDFSMDSFKTTTKKIFSTILQDKVSPTTNRVSYNYDFSVTIKPININPNNNNLVPVNGIGMVIKGVNNIIQPITDIAGRVITAGTDIAGIVLNALGVRRTY